MMRLVITGYSDGKKIHAIKGIRAATGRDLRGAKDVADGIDMGKQPEIEVAPENLRVLDEHGVLYHEKTSAVTVPDLIAALERYPRSLRVGDLSDVLKRTEWTAS